MRSCRTLWTLFALSVSAQNNALPVSGVLKSGPGNTPAALEVTDAAGRNPNATNSVTFTQLYNNSPDTWTWRVNISDIAVPNRIDDLGRPSANFSEGLRVANTQWQLEWPGSDGTLESYLAERDMSITFYAMLSSKPNNITSRYKATDNGNCSAVLGNDCVQSLMRAASSNVAASFSNLEGCGDTLDIYIDGPGAGSSFSIGAANRRSNSSDSSALSRNSTFFYSTSVPYTASNLTELHLVESALQVLILSAQYGAGPHGESSGPTVLCQIVDNSGDTTKAKDDTSAAASWHQSVAAVWSVVVFSTLAIFW